MAAPYNDPNVRLNFAKHTATCIIGPHKFLGNILAAKFGQLHYFLSKNIVGTKDIASPLVQKQLTKLEVTCTPLKLGLFLQ